MMIRSLAATVLALALPVAAYAQVAGAKPTNNLRNPKAATEKAPDTYKARFDTSAGPFVIEVHRDWAPIGADRFYNLVKNGFYDGVRFHRVIQSPRPFMVQFGINGTPAVQAIWRSQRLKDDPVKQSNKRGYVTFAKTSEPDSRTTQVFINYNDNSPLDSDRFAPFGQVVEGMDVVEKFYAQYGSKPADAFVRIENEGNAFLTKEFPRLDYIKKATIEP